jgi:hypothetical protein
MKREEALPLRRIQRWNWYLLVLLAAASALVFDPGVTRGVVAGGLLANTSFWLLKRDLSKLLQGDAVGLKGRFFLRYYARLALLAVILFLLIKYGSLDIIGLLIGLSVVFLSIGGVALGGALKLFKNREAS